MAKCKHENTVDLSTTDIFALHEIRSLLEHGNLDYIQQIEDSKAVRIVTVTTRFCPACGRIYGEITAAA